MKKHLTKTRIAVYIALLCLLGLTAAPATYARFTARVEGSAVASAAVWASESSEIKIDVSELTPGKTSLYKFKVTNKKGGAGVFHHGGDHRKSSPEIRADPGWRVVGR